MSFRKHIGDLSMRLIIFVFLFLLSALRAETTSTLTSKEKVELFSEYVGYMFGRELSLMKLPYNAEALARGVKAHENGLSSPLNSLTTDEGMFELILSIQEDLFEKQAVENRVRAEAFLHKINQNPASVMVVNKQLYYKTIAEGRGTKVVQEGSEPRVYYSVHTLDGTEIANTFENQKPICIPLADAIPGFVKGVIGMKEGERRKIYIHPDLAYRRGGDVPPNSLLIFDIEVVEL